MSNWISYSPSSGTGDGTICVSSSANTGATSGECRSDYIVVYNRDYGVENKVNVLQYPQNPNLTISPGLPQHIRISPSGGTATISVSSNINWATEVFWDEYPEFLTATPSTGFGNGTITVSAPPYYPGKERKNDIFVVNRFLELYQECPVYQGYISEYLTLDVLTDGLFVVVPKSTESDSGDIEFSVSYNDGTWETHTVRASGIIPTTYYKSVTAGTKIRVKNVVTEVPTSRIAFVGTNFDYNVYGNVLSLYYGDEIETASYFDDFDITIPYAFASLFKGTNVIDASNLAIPAKTITGERCCWEMFKNCNKLNVLPTLQAVTLSSYCYSSMFEGCTGLTSASTIELPSLTLANNCYEYMFKGCTRITTSPDLPAVRLKPYCYREMFRGCSWLNRIKCLATDISATNCTKDWVRDAYTHTSDGVFTKDHSAVWPSGNNGIPNGWKIINV